MKKHNLTLLLVFALSLLLGVAHVALGLAVGFNPDIHMDVPGVIANDFHIEGRIESGMWGGNWSQPPKLLDHVDDLFPNFNYIIKPDPDDPGQNWYLFFADWSGHDYRFCEVLHLGLLFDVTCHNVVIDLVGWWTFNGEPVVPIPPPPDGPPNGGSVPIPGFEVQDMPIMIGKQLEIPQTYEIRNDSHLFGGAVAEQGIYTEVVQLELVALSKEELEEFLGPMPRAFRELRLGGAQENLPWIPVGPMPWQLAPGESLLVVLDGSEEPGPVEPIEIGPGDFLIARVLIQYMNNNNEPDLRWEWHMHEAHEGDLGDAPDSTNSFGGMPMTAYPAGGPPGVKANFPTVYIMGSPPHGPIHRQPLALAHLGQSVSMEMEADMFPDQDGINNIIPPQDTPDRDKFDDCLVNFPLSLPLCQATKFDYLVNVFNPNRDLYVNVWFDWNRDGDWDDTPECPDGVIAPEWAVQNQLLPAGSLTAGMNQISTPSFMPWHPAAAADQYIWMRITLAERPTDDIAGADGFGGAGPAIGYRFGETEDYYFIPRVPEPDLDFGDAPEVGTNYPTTLARNGARHVIVPRIYLGNSVDPELNGQPNASASGDDIDGNDDEDGVVFNTLPLIPGQPAVVVVTASVGGGFLDAWIDFNKDGSWAQLGDQIFGARPLAAGPNPLVFIVPTTATPEIATFARFRFSTMQGLPFDGQAPNGEVEDYTVRIGKEEEYFIKWSQPPMLKPDSPYPTCFWGWDEFSVYGGPQIVADDWICEDNRPITDIHWWGSYLGWEGGEPPPDAPTAFHIGIWTDVPAGVDQQWSHPGVMIWEWKVDRNELKERPVGCDFCPEYMDKPDICFRYDYIIPEDLWFFQEPGPTVYWISISARYPAGGVSDYPWGWKTREHFFNDFAVIIGDPTRPEVGNKFIAGGPIWEGWDMAFELTTIERELAELGDAPDSSNNSGASMTTYPAGVQAHFPTVFQDGSGTGPFGPIHRRPKSVAFLGDGVTWETEADIGWDQDGLNNIDPPNNTPDQDQADDGVIFPLNLPHCRWATFNYQVNVVTPVPTIYVNVWFDWNRDADWDDMFNCARGPAREWAVRNQVLLNLPAGLQQVTTPAFLSWHPQDGPEDIWMRITLSEKPWRKSFISVADTGYGGCGPRTGYDFGETEDYYFIPDTSCLECADLNCDGIVNLVDFVILASQWLSSCP